MIALFDFIPSFCPNCGQKFSIKDDKYCRQDFWGGCAHTCSKCGMHFQKKTIFTDNTFDPEYWTEKKEDGIKCKHCNKEMNFIPAEGCIDTIFADYDVRGKWICECCGREYWETNPATGNDGSEIYELKGAKHG